MPKPLLKTKVTELLDIDCPIVQAGMIWCSGWELASAVSNAGGLGIIGAGSMYPKELEEIIDNQAGVLESAVIGVPHPDFGETPVAIVVQENETKIDMEPIINKLKKSLARYKHPRRLIVTGQLPRNSMGKVQKNVLRESYKDLFHKD